MEHGRSASDFDDLVRQVRQLTALVAEQQATMAQQQATIAVQQEALTRVLTAVQNGGAGRPKLVALGG